MADQPDNTGGSPRSQEQVGQDQGAREQAGRRVGVSDDYLHKFIWPLAPWKNTRLVVVPLNYLRKFTSKPPGPWHNHLYSVAKAEMKRRAFITSSDFIHFTEHAYERFTQFFPGLVKRVQIVSHQVFGVGVTTVMKALFRKALDTGRTTQAQGNDGRNYHVVYRNFRWTYGLYKSGKEQEFKVISVFPTAKRYRRKQKGKPAGQGGNESVSPSGSPNRG